MRPSDRRRRRHWQGIGLIPNLQRNQSPHRRPHRIQTSNRRPRNRHRRSGLLHPRHRGYQRNPIIHHQITTDHPDLDCLINNAGVQRPLEINKLPSEEFLSKADQEININIRGPMHLALNLLSHLRTKPHAAIINVPSILGFVPFSIINPVYNATKAWVHFWTMNLRTQSNWAGDGERIRVAEVAPPGVESDLHREREDPDDNKKSKNKDMLSIEEFMGEVEQKLEAGEEVVTAGMGNEAVGKWYGVYGEMYEKAAR